MEVLAVFIGLGLTALVVIGPVLGLIGFARSSRMQRDLRDLQTQMATLEARLSALVKTRAASPPAAEAPAEPAGAAVRAPSPGREARPAPPPPAPLPVPGASVSVPVPAPSVSPPAAEPVPPVSAPTPPPSAPAPPKAPPVPSVPPRPSAPPPPTPPRTATPAPPPPAEPAFDWESLLGVKGAAWIGAVALVVTGILFVKWASDRNLITPEMKISIVLASGVAALVWAELSLRRGYAPTSNAVSGAGIAILYAGLLGAHSLYNLIPLGATFFFMALVTVVAGLLAIRYDAMFTALLGLLGGFATPLALSTGQDRPIGLFSYILLLNVGLFAVALRKGWHGLVTLALIGTVIIEMGWFGRFMAPEKMVVGLLVFLLFGLLYLLLPFLTPDRSAGGEAGGDPLAGTAAIGAAMPFVFGVVLAGNARYVPQWPLLFGFIGLLDAALAAVALYRRRTGLLVAGAAATALTLPLWAAQGLGPANVWGPLLAAAGLSLGLNLPRRLAEPLSHAVRPRNERDFEVAGTLAGIGLGVFAVMLIGRAPTSDLLWPFLTLLAALTVILAERTGPRRMTGVALLAPPAVAALVQIWFFAQTRGDALLRHLSVPQLFALAVSLLAARRRRGEGGEDEAGVVLATGLAVLGLFLCLTNGQLSADGWPLFAALAVSTSILVTSALRRGWGLLVPAALLTSAALLSFWHVGYFKPSDAGMSFAWIALFYLAFLILPFLVPDGLGWKRQGAPWAASALAGPVFFLVLDDTWRQAFGPSAIGLLPVILAALSVIALAGITQRFPREGASPTPTGLRLRYLALFAALALGFVAVAIPLQLDRQWMTLGWALEGVAVWWLYRKLPHAGLAYFGAALFATVGVRLILNVENVMGYQPRGWPIVNWLLYTYGLAAVCCLVGGWLLREADAVHGPFADPLRARFAPGASFLGLILVFVLINLEIADYFSTGTFVQFGGQRGMARDLTTSASWALYAMLLLVLGVWRHVRPLRFVSLGFLILTVAKVFLYDLSNLTGLYQILAFLGLGVSLIVVSLFYQRFVFKTESRP